MTSASDIQIGGDHYRTMAIQPKDFILKNGIGWAEGVAIEYLSRWRSKGGLLDLSKAIHSIELLIESEKDDDPFGPMPSKPADFALVYLATPYSKYPAGIEAAFQDAAAIAGRLVTTGVRVYSPIAHTHPLAIFAGIDPLSHDIWLPFDEAMMCACQALLVAHMDGWDQSRGVAHEIEVFEKAGKPIFDLDPVTLVATLRTEGGR